MEEILEKFKMLDYEEHFKSFRPLTHTYFAMPSANPNEQFYYSPRSSPGCSRSSANICGADSGLE